MKKNECKLMIQLLGQSGMGEVTASVLLSMKGFPVEIPGVRRGAVCC